MYVGVPLIYLPPFFENNNKNKYRMWVELSVFSQQYLNLTVVLTLFCRWGQKKYMLNPGK